MESVKEAEKTGKPNITQGKLQREQREIIGSERRREAERERIDEKMVPQVVDFSEGFWGTRINDDGHVSVSISVKMLNLQTSHCGLWVKQT